VQKAAYELHQLRQDIIPFSKIESQHGEMYQYDSERFSCFLLKTFQLDEIAREEPVELSITLDGTELCDGISHLTARIKITAGRAIDPQTGVPLCTADDDTFGSIFKNQSRNFCFAMEKTLRKPTRSSRIF
jgi:hypothetical protein